MSVIFKHMLKLNSGVYIKKSTQLLRTLLFIIILSIGASSSFANTSLPKNDKRSIRKKTRLAKTYFVNRNYNDAAPVLYDLLLLDRRNTELNNMLGVCYFHLESEKEKSTEYLEKAIRYTKSKNNIPLIYYYNLGKSYHVNYQFRKAIRTYNNLLNLIPREDSEYIANIEHEIDICKNAIDLTENPVNIKVENLGNLINTEYAEHSPGMTADETTMVFTSRRNGTGNQIDTDGQYFEDIYISHRVNDVWTEPEGIKILNTKDHDASISLSADGQEIYVYKAGYQNNDESDGGDIYVSKLNGDNWTKPQKLHSDINSPSKESHISISADARTIYFSSNRPGGYGKMDIYSVKKLPNGKWGPAQNLGPNINTEYDEEAPFIHHDGINLYFSSKGHKTMGGFDVFKATFDNGRWQKPVNVGFPINSTKEDIYYTPTPDGKRAYMASYREGSLGRTDIFRIQTPDSEKTGLFVLKGKLVNRKGKAIGKAKIKISLNNKTVGLYHPNTASGRFLFVINAGKQYNLEIRAESYRPLSTIMNVPEEYANKENHSVITLLPLALHLEDEEDYPENINIIDYDASRIKLKKEILTPKIDTELDDSELKKTAIQNEFSDKIEPKTNNKPTKNSNGIGLPKTILKTGLPISLPRFSKNKKAKTETQSKNKIQSEQTKTAIKTEIPISTSKTPLNQNSTKEIQTKNKIHIELPKIPVKTGIPISTPKFPINQNLKKEIQSENQPKKEIEIKEEIKLTSPIPSAPSLAPVFFTIDFNVSDSKSIAKLKEIPGIEKIESAGKNPSYVQGRFKNYKDAQKAKQVFTKKGLKDIKIRMIQGYEIVKESEPKENYYTIQILALQLPLAPEMFNQLDNVKVYQGSDGLSRFTYKKFKSLIAAKQELNRLVRIGYWDSFIQTVINGELVYPKMKFSTSTAYTIQLMSLREVKPVSYFKNLKGVNVYRDTDNIYRYTYKIFPTKAEALLALGDVLKKSYWDAFVRKAYWGEEALFAHFDTKKTYKYTIQIMALNNAKSLNYFNNLPAERLNMNKGKDGLSRYTFEAFDNKKNEKTYLKIALKKGYYDAFTRTIKWYNKH